MSFGDGWWAGPAAQGLLGTVLRVSLLLMGLFVVLAVIDGLIHSDTGAMIRAAFVEVPVSLFATATLIVFVTAGLEISDGLSAAFLGGPLDGTSFIAAFGEPDAVIKAGLLGPLLVAVFVLGGLAVWVELVIRASLIYLLVMLAPLFLAARIWPAAKRSWRRLVELGVALIAAKPVIAIALAVGCRGARPWPGGRHGRSAGRRERRRDVDRRNVDAAGGVLTVRDPETRPGGRGRGDGARYPFRGGTRGNDGRCTGRLLPTHARKRWVRRFVE